MPTFNQIGPGVEVGSGGTTTITFSSIPSGYTDLIVKFSGRHDSATTPLPLAVRFNGAAGSRSSRAIRGDGATVVSISNSNTQSILVPGNNFAANVFGSADIYIPNYAISTNKSFNTDSIAEDNAVTSYTYLNSGAWLNTAAITSVEIFSGVTNHFQYTTAYLYGVSNA